MRGVMLGVAVAILALLMPSSSAAPLAQMDAFDDPSTEGPLTLTDSKCDRKARKSGGETVAVVKRCLRFYAFDPSMESDATADYGIAWLQSNVDAKNRWCAKRVASDILLPDGVGVHDFDPQGSTPINSIRGVTSRLVADAEGTASTEGRISQEWVAYPVRIRGLLRNEGTVARVKWVGMSKAKLGFAGGVEISWPPDMPPDGVSYQLNFALGSPNSC